MMDEERLNRIETNLIALNAQVEGFVKNIVWVLKVETFALIVLAGVNVADLAGLWARGGLP